MTQQLDIILFGASGFTGTYCIKSLHKLTKSDTEKVRWGIAGRSERKLKEVLQECADEIGEDLSSVPLVIADVSDFESLKRMTAQAKVIINCCGPYMHYGEPVVKACIETGTHQLDLSGEMYYMEALEYNYSKAAEEKGVYIISASGFDSVPSDLGLLLLQEKFEGTINSVENYLELYGGGIGSGANYGTYESFIYTVAASRKLTQLRKKLYPTPLPKFQPRLETRYKIHKSSLINKWCIPFHVTDHSVMERTQRYLHTHQKLRPIQIQSYFGLQSLFHLIVMVVLVTVITLFSKFKWGLFLLRNHPAFFTNGVVTKKHPLKLAQKNTRFIITLQAKGWNEKSDVHKTSPSTQMVARISGNDPAYTLTANIITLAAIVILSESEKLPKSGGVYTPGIAYKKTSLFERAQANGLKFEIL